MASIRDWLEEAITGDKPDHWDDPSKAPWRDDQCADLVSGEVVVE